jgi:putative nucleotidyltransferase with HDIG domain
METGRLIENKSVPVSGIKKQGKFPSHWLPVYITVISLLGFFITILAFWNVPADWLGLLVFAGLAAGAQLLRVELFSNSRSHVSVESMIAIASVLLFGPLAGALVHLAGGVTASFAALIRDKESTAGRVSWFKRMAFNTGMLVTATAIGGWTYQLAGGTIGDLWKLSNVLPLIGAVTVNVLVNIVVLIGVLTLQTGRNPANIWEEGFRWAAPIAIAGGVLGGGVLALAYQMFQFLGLAVFTLPVLATSYSFRTYVNNMRVYVDKLEEANLSLEEVNIGLLGTLGAIIDAYDRYTYGHSTQVAEYAKALSEKLELSAEEKDRIYKAALIHDLGKVSIMDSIMGKPGPLTDEEYNILKRHPVIGAEIIGRMKGLQDLVPLVQHHHERWDGRGYPDGLEGEEIPLGARILALADSLDAMLSDRAYRPTRTFKEVIEEVARCSGTQFDPKVVLAFFKVKDEKPRDFFKNSAAYVENSILTNKIDYSSNGFRYLVKKELLDRHRN